MRWPASSTGAGPCRRGWSIGRTIFCDACRIVGDRLGITIRPAAAEDLLRADPLTAIARVSKIRFRRVGLADGWWRREGEPLVGELIGGGHVALLPFRRRWGYQMIDPVSG